MHRQKEAIVRFVLKPVDNAVVTILVDNVIDVFMPDHGPARRPPVGDRRGGYVRAPLLETGEVPDGLLAEHGFAAAVTVTRGKSEHRLLFDAGRTPDGLVENMRRLDLSPNDLEAIVLSHGHLDHTTGMNGLVRVLGRSNLPVMIHPEFWAKRRIVIPGQDPFELPSTSRSALEGAGFEITEDQRPSFILDESLMVTGEIDRTTQFERGFPPHQALRGGEWVADPLVLDDQALVFTVAGRGLVVLTGCGHAGVINTVRYAQKLTGVDQVHAIIGGFHLSGPLFEPIIPRVCEALRAFEPEVVVPTHCTGWRAIHALAQALPDAFIPSSVGTRFEFSGRLDAGVAVQPGAGTADVSPRETV